MAKKKTTGKSVNGNATYAAMGLRTSSMKKPKSTKAKGGKKVITDPRILD